MRREIAFLITIALSSVAFSKEPVDRSVRAPAQGTEMALIAPGVLEHVNEKGENVRIFQGAEGLNVLLSEKRLELRKLIEAHGEEAASGLRKLVADLEVSASLVEPLGVSDSQLKSTLSQTISLNPYIPQICYKRLYPSANFQVTFGMVNYPVVTGEFPPFGWGSQVGPPAPMPDSTFRSVYVKLDHRTDYYPSSEASTHLYASRTGITFGCTMETLHTVEATCFDTTQFTSVEVVQTCSNVGIDAPPTITVP